MKRKIIAKVAFSLAVTCGILSFPSCGEKNMKLSDIVDFVLEVESGREVRILQLTDIQIIDGAQCRTEERLPDTYKQIWAIENIQTLAWQYMDWAVQETSPDLIVLTGDNVYGEFDDSGTSLKLLIDQMDGYGIPWTLTYGNHDNETALGARWQNQQFVNAKNCMFTHGSDEAEGNGNFTIGITQDGKLTEVLYMLDSHGCVNLSSEERVYSEKGILEGQKQWYASVSSKLKSYNGGENVKSLGFFHHPLRAFGDGLRKYGYTSLKNDFYDTPGNWQPFSVVEIGIKNEEGDWGIVNEDCDFIDNDYGFFNLLLENGTEGVFFGHNHTNAASVEYQGIRLTYGVKSSVYDSHDEGLLGGTLIQIGEDSFDVSPYFHKNE